VRSGRRATAIANVLVLSPSTVRNHLTSIYHKLGVRSHSELVELLHAHGLTAS
jgi:DNA-binding CsgD family transcriptional regulator